jgi:hypothetical protein
LRTSQLLNPIKAVDAAVNMMLRSALQRVTAIMRFGVQMTLLNQILPVIWLERF